MPPVAVNKSPAFSVRPPSAVKRPVTFNAPPIFVAEFVLPMVVAPNVAPVLVFIFTACDDNVDPL